MDSQTNSSHPESGDVAVCSDEAAPVEGTELQGEKNSLSVSRTQIIIHLWYYWWSWSAQNLNHY